MDFHCIYLLPIVLLVVSFIYALLDDDWDSFMRVSDIVWFVTLFFDWED